MYIYWDHFYKYLFIVFDLDDNMIIVRQLVNYLSWMDKEKWVKTFVNVYWDHFYKYLFIEQNGWFER